MASTIPLHRLPASRLQPRYIPSHRWRSCLLCSYPQLLLNPHLRVLRLRRLPPPSPHDPTSSISPPPPPAPLLACLLLPTPPASLSCLTTVSVPVVVATTRLLRSYWLQFLVLPPTSPPPCLCNTVAARSQHHLLQPRGQSSGHHGQWPWRPHLCPLASQYLRLHPPSSI
uniref:Uncharacterized protein n=1 Tax=Triticum urartu TaxID=4572 RepID=A0A8R7UTF2_TRIUA